MTVRAKVVPVPDAENWQMVLSDAVTEFGEHDLIYVLTEPGKGQEVAVALARGLEPPDTAEEAPVPHGEQTWFPLAVRRRPTANGWEWFLCIGGREVKFGPHRLGIFSEKVERPQAARVRLIRALVVDQS